MEPEFGAQASQSLPLSQNTFSELWDTLMPFLQSEAPPEPLSEEYFDLGPEAAPPGAAPPQTATVPLTTDYPGEYGFGLSFQKTGTAKSVPSTFSEQLNKLYCKMAETTPIQVMVGREPPVGALVRAMAVYKKAEHVADVVRRCPHHQNEDAAEHRCHLIRVEGSQRVQYHEDANTMRHSVTVPYEPPQLGSHQTTVLLTFMCNSSCMGGMNRRPVLIILTLETLDGSVLGRRCFEARICACPGRDRKTEEENAAKARSGKQLKKRKSASGQDGTEAEKKHKSASSADDDDEVFTLRVRGRQNYEILKKINDAFELQDKAGAKSKTVVKTETPAPSSGKRVMLRDKSDSE